MRRHVHLWALLWAVAGLGETPALALHGQRPLDRPWAEDAGFRIEWEGNWQATVEANTKRWRTELQAPKRDRRLQAELLVLRRVRLLEALIKRYADDADRKIAARKEVAACFGQLGCSGRANYQLKALAEEFPWRPEAAEALQTILERTSRSPTSVEEGEAWVDYAAGRLIAMQRAVYLPVDHPAVLLAWRARLAQRMRQHRFWEASKALDRLAELTGRDDAWRSAEAELNYQAGRRLEALEGFQDLLEREVRGSAKSRVRQLEREGGGWPATFPTVASLEGAWDRVRSRWDETAAAALLSLIEKSAREDVLIPAADGCHTSLWASIDRQLQARGPEAVSSLRRAQEGAAQRLVSSARRDGNAAALTAAYRRHPWAAAVHKGLLERGEEALLRGHSGLARRAFEDVLSHACDPAMRARATVGLGFAIVHDTRTPRAVLAPFRDVADDEPLPWMGGRKPASFVRERLLATARAEGTDEPRLASVKTLKLRAPPVSPWPPVAAQHSKHDILRRLPFPLPRLQADGRHVLLGGPNLLAAYGDDLSKPLWWRTARAWRESGTRRVSRRSSGTVRGPFRPALADGRVYSRWGLDGSGQELTGLAAFDAASGRVLWATHGDRAWSELLPVSDPAVADGRVYVLATRASPTPVQPLFLVCLDAEDGALLWQRLLGTRRLGLARAGGSPNLPWREVDLAHYGSALTVREGAVYCQTSAGFVARCDARDGLVEWARTYPRVRLGVNTLDVFRREGAAPVIAGGVVVFLPRDGEGLFAVDRESGVLLWDRPLLPSDDAVGLAGRTLVVRDAEQLVGLDVSRGDVAWERRFEGGLAWRPALAGSSIYVGTREAVYRLSASSGLPLEERPWDPKAPIHGLIARGRALVAVTEESPATRAEGTPLSARPAAEALRLPLRRAWQLPRPRPILYCPPVEAQVPNRLYVLSEGVLECLTTERGGAIAWRRALAREPVALAWAERTMLFAYPRRVLALDAVTGARRWETRLPFEATDWRACGPYLFVGNLRGNRHTSLVRLSDGRLLWHRKFLGTLPGDPRHSFEGVGWDGERLHLVTRYLGRDRKPADLLVRPADGRIVASRPFPGADEPWPHKLACADGQAFAVSPDGTLLRVSLRDGAVARYGVTIEKREVGRIRQIDFVGPWVHVRWHPRGREHTHGSWVLRRDGRGGVVRRPDDGLLRGDTLFEIPKASRTVTAVDLPSGRAVACHLPLRPDAFRRVVDAHATKDSVWVVSESLLSGNEWGLRADAFDRGSGAHVGGQALRGTMAGSAQVAWAKGTLFIADARGLHAYAAGAPPAARRAPHLAHPAEGPIRVDGILDDWPRARTLRLEGDPKRDGTLRIAHDETHLYLAVRHRDPAPRPRVGRGVGDWLEVGLTTDLGSFRWGVGLDARGRVAWDRLGGGNTPRGLRAAIRHGLGSDEVVYELAVPRAAVFTEAGTRWRRFGLSLAVWDERPDTPGSARVLTFGGALGGPQLLPSAHETVYLRSLTLRQYSAAAAILRELPELPASIEFFKQDTLARDASAQALVEAWWGFIKRHPRSMAAERLLVEIDSKLREGPKAEPVAQILRRAAEAGVPAPARRRYERYARTYLSQWVHVAEGARPRSVLVMLNGGSGSDEWGHRAHWGGPARHWAVPPAAMGRVEDIPQGAWHELRVPLRRIGMHDKPIFGMSFLQQGGGRIVWDRSAVVVDGRENVFLDDEARGTTQWVWEWVAEPVHSGAKAHTTPPPAKANDIVAHVLAELDEPVMAHLDPPLDRPYLSQWVFLDRANPPTVLAVDLHDGARWAFRATWGKRMQGGRYLGPVPRPGVWRELRIPLAWTPFLTRPIAGLAFNHRGGRVFWDRTALVVGAKEHVLLDDELPPTRPPGDRLEWRGWLEGHVGATRPVPGKVGAGMLCDGHSTYVRVPHSPELDPPEFTLEAWIYADALPPHGVKRWIINKNLHAGTDGFFALMICGDKVVGDLNIGGQLANRYQAWTPPGALKARQWHHIAVTFDGADLKTYRDAELLITTPVNKPRKPGTGHLFIGRWASWPRYFAGIIDEARVYRRALSADELKARHAHPETLAPAVADAVVGYWGFDDQVAPADPTVHWQWVGAPVHSGKRAHTHARADGFAGHFVTGLRKPITQHLPFDLAHATTVLRTHVPRLGGAPDAWHFFESLLKLQVEPEQRIELCEWFLRAVPRHPQALGVLRTLLESHRDAGTPDPAGVVEAAIKASDLSPKTLYDYHRRCVPTRRSYVRTWQLLGPFPAPGRRPFGPPLPPDGGPVRLDKTYRGAMGDVRWTRYASPTAYVEFEILFTPNDDVVAYAACWIHSDRARPAVVAIGSDDDCFVWLNRRRIIRGNNYSYVVAGEFVAPVELSAGWNEVLVRVNDHFGPWGFYFELLDAKAREPLPGVRFSTSPPRRAPRNGGR